MPEYKFELEMSDYFKHRAELLKTNGAPKLSDAKFNLGNIMAKVAFEQCEEALREDFGLKKPLKGPGDTLWVSPSDVLINKVALKPPFTPKCLQALSHKGILQIGETLEVKFKQEMETQKQRAMERYKNELMVVFEDRMKGVIKDLELKERIACEMELERQEEEFKETLKRELDNLEINIREQYESLIEKRTTNLEMSYDQRRQAEVRKTVEAMTSDYMQQLQRQEERFAHAFELEIRKREALRESDHKFYKRKTVESLRQLKHNLECTNLVNMMYVLCTERNKCTLEKKRIEEYYKTEIAKLQERLKDRDKKLAAVIAEMRKKELEVAIRESCLSDVLRHFQKFISFAMKASPTQAEFLLSLEKMMVFELANRIAKAKLSKQPKEEPKLVPWSSEDKLRPSSAKSLNLEIQDHHNCLEELNPRFKRYGSEYGEQEDLPAIYFNNKTYVREDFRDMLACGVEIKPNHELWSKDVDSLVDHLEEQQKQKDDSVEVSPVKLKEAVSIDHMQTVLGSMDADSIFTDTGRRRSTKSAVQFSRRSSGPSTKLSTSESTRRKSLLKPFSDHAIVEPSEITPDVRTKSAILAARDSLELLIEKHGKSFHSTAALEDNLTIDERVCQDTILEVPGQEVAHISEHKSKQASNDLAIETKDSVIMRIAEMEVKRMSNEFAVSPRDSIELVKHVLEDKGGELKSKSSRLTMARNSVEMLKESLHRMQQPSLICQKKDKRRDSKGGQTPPSPPLFHGTCCERCKRKEDSGSVISSPKEPSKTNSLVVGTDGVEERSVKISYVQIINLDTDEGLKRSDQSPSVVSFQDKPIFMQKKASKEIRRPATSVGTRSTRSAKRSSRRKPIEKKEPEYHCRVVGDRFAREGDQTPNEFTAERIHSLISLMKNQPYLMQLFTSGVR